MRQIKLRAWCSDSGDNIMVYYDNMFTKESLEYFYLCLKADIAENNEVIREQENFWTDVVFLHQSPIYKDRIKRRDMLAESMCRVNEQLDALKEHEIVNAG